MKNINDMEFEPAELTKLFGRKYPSLGRVAQRAEKPSKAIKAVKHIDSRIIDKMSSWAICVVLVKRFVGGLWSHRVDIQVVAFWVLLAVIVWVRLG